MPTILLIIVELFSIALLSWYCVTESSADIESDLTRRSTAALAYAGIHDARVIIDGQNAELRGSVDTPDEVKLAAKTVTSVWGVEHVINRLNCDPGNDQPEQPLPGNIQPANNKSPTSQITLSSPGAHDTTQPASSVNSAKSCNKALQQALKKGKIRFERGSDELTEESTGILDNIAAALGSCPHSILKITGHTDATGREADNQVLSQKRAEAVAGYLHSRHLPQEQLRTEGLGETHPVANNSTAAGRERNRRIEFILIDNPDSALNPVRTP